MGNGRPGYDIGWMPDNPEPYVPPEPRSSKRIAQCIAKYGIEPGRFTPRQIENARRYTNGETLLRADEEWPRS